MLRQSLRSIATVLRQRAIEEDAEIENAGGVMRRVQRAAHSGALGATAAGAEHQLLHRFDHARAGHACATQAGGCRGAVQIDPCSALYVSVAGPLKGCTYPFAWLVHGAFAAAEKECACTAVQCLTAAVPCSAFAFSQTRAGTVQALVLTFGSAVLKCAAWLGLGQCRHSRIGYVGPNKAGVMFL